MVPTKVSDTLYVGLEVVDKQDMERDGVVSSRQVVENQNGEEVVASIMKLLIGLIVN